MLELGPFALRVYRWIPASQVARRIWVWWQQNARAGRAAILYCYALGKSQRLLAELADL